MEIRSRRYEVSASVARVVVRWLEENIVGGGYYCYVVDDRYYVEFGDCVSEQIEIEFALRFA